MLKGSNFNNEVVDSNARSTNAGGISEAQDKANALYSRLTGTSFELVPSAYKENTVYSGTGVNGDLSFTRAGDAWRTNKDGLIQRVPWNLLKYSEQSDNAIWGKEGSTVSANTTIAPNGTTTADTITEGSLGGQHRIYQGSPQSSNIYTLSVYVKNITGTRQAYIDLGLFKAFFNFASETTFSPTGISTFQNVGNGWYRFSVTSTSAITISTIYIGLGQSNSETYTGNGTSAIAFWGAQLIEGANPLPYFSTTDRLNVPRLDYSYGSTPSLLLEPQRTNLFLWSGQLSDASWSKQNCTITANSSISPDGTQTASLVDDGIAASTQHWVFQNPGFVYNTTYTISFYAKYVSRKYMSVNIYNGVTSQYVDYDIQNGTVFGATGDVTASVINAGNGWYRVIYTRTIAASGSPNLRIALADDTASESYTGSNKQVLIWGLQFEAGAYPSSYIGTTTASATRLVDGFSRSNFFANGIVTSSGGTWFIEFKNNISYTRDGVGWIQLEEAVGTNLQIRFGNVANRILILKTISGANSTLYTTTTTTAKILFKWNGITVDVFVNGVKVVTASPFTITNFNTFNSTNSDAPRYIQQMALFPTPLSDTDCINLTSDYTDGSSVTNTYEQYVNNLGGTVENLSGVTNLIQNLK
jgi:hypothetical protein